MTTDNAEAVDTPCPKCNYTPGLRELLKSEGDCPYCGWNPLDSTEETDEI